MTAISFVCPLCGHSFDPGAHASCASCPLNAGCRMVCCPNCGHTTVDPHESRLARWAAALLSPGRRAPAGAAAQGARPLTALPPRSWARVVGGGAPAGAQLARLQAYGVSAGALVEVLQQRPVTVIRIEHTELAIEAEVAAGLLVEPV